MGNAWANCCNLLDVKLESSAVTVRVYISVRDAIFCTRIYFIS